MKLKRFIIALCLLHGFLLYSQNGQQGTDFWLTFGRNGGAYFNLDFELQIRIVTDSHEVTGAIHFTALGTSIPFTTGVNNVFTHVCTPEEKEALYNDTTGITNRTAHITSSAPVTVSALNQSKSSADATLIFPVEALGTNYYYITYENYEVNQDVYAVVATQDGTEVYHNQELCATLNRGEVYHRASWIDMTGACITSNKPVALFAMNEGSIIPYNSQPWDNLYEQLPPVRTWGKSFFVPVAISSDFVRIVASEDNTNINLTGAVIREGNLSLNAGQFLEVSVNGNSAYITADKPVGVCTFLKSQWSVGTPSDPSQAWVPSLDQTVESVIMAPLIPSGITNLRNHNALIITPTATKNDTRVKIGDGAEQPLSGGTWIDNTAAGMSFYSMPLAANANSAYVYTNPAGVIIMAYGTGDCESYYYVASAMRTLNTSFYVNDIYYQHLTLHPIHTQPVQFRAEIEDELLSKQEGHIKWYINGAEEATVYDSLNWEKTLSCGMHTVKMEVVMKNGTSIIREATLMVNHAFIPMSINICQGDSYNFNGKIYTMSGIYKDTLTNGCGSIIELTLTVNPTYTTPIAENICQGDSYNFNGKICTVSGIYKDTLQTISGCDSIIELTLTVNPSYIIAIVENICQGDSYYFNGKICTVTGIYRDTLQTVNGCDSIFELDLTVNPLPDIPSIEKNGNDLISSAANRYQWYFNNASIVGATNQNYTCTQNGIYFVEVANEHGCTSKSDEINVTGVGILEQTKEKSSIVVFPNPARNEIFIRSDLQAEKVEIYSITGVLLLSENNFKEKMSVSTLPAGVYMLKVYTEKGLTVRKVVKE